MSAILEWVMSMTIDKLRVPASLAAYFALAGVILGTALAFGMVSPVFGGFARATRVNQIAAEINHHVTKIQQENNEHWANQTATALLRMQQASCALAHNQLRRMYDRLIQAREMEYYKLTGHAYRLPRCSDL